MNLDNAIAVHAQWKMKFRSAIAAEESLDAATIGRDDCCEVGQWLHGEGKRSWGTKPEFVGLLEKHKTFHAEAGKVAGVINSRNFALATRMIDAGTPFIQASNAVGVAILGLKKIVGQAAKA